MSRIAVPQVWNWPEGAMSRNAEQASVELAQRRHG